MCTRTDNTEALWLVKNDSNLSAGMLFGMANTTDNNETSGRAPAGRLRVGPFVVVTPVSVDEMKLIDYMMNEDLDEW